MVGVGLVISDIGLALWAEEEPAPEELLEEKWHRIVRYDENGLPTERWVDLHANRRTEAFLPKEEKFDDGRYATWAETEPLEAITHADETHTGNDRLGGIFRALSVWATNDPEPALAWSVKQPLGQNRINFIVNVLVWWAMHDGAEAAKHLDLVVPGRARERAIQKIANGWTKQDPFDVAEWIVGLPASDGQRAALYEVGASLVEKNEERAIAMMLEFASGEQREHFVRGCLVELARRDPEQAFGLAVDLLQSPLHQNNLLPMVFQHWCRVDYDGALEAALAMTEGSIRTRLLGDLITNGIRDDLETVIARVESLPRGLSRDQILNRVVGKLIFNDPVMASKFADEIDDMDVWGGASRNLVDHYFKSDRDGAIEWIESIESNHRRAFPLQMILGQLATADLEKATRMALASTHHPKDLPRRMLLGVIASEIARLDPVRASVWVESLDWGHPETRGAEAIVGMQWRQVDEVAAEAWRAKRAEELGDWMFSEQNRNKERNSRIPPAPPRRGGGTIDVTPTAPLIIQ